MKGASFVSCLLLLTACGSCEEEADAGGATSASAAPTAPVAAPPVGARGPFASIEAYCATALEGLSADQCEGPTEEYGNVCRCERASSPTITGPTSARGPGASVDELVLVATQTTGSLDCRLALHTASGVYIVDDVATCGESPMAHDSGYALETRTLSATRSGESVEVVFEWEEKSQTSPDVDSEDQEWSEQSEGQFRVTCSVDAAASVRCNPRQTLSPPAAQ